MTESMTSGEGFRLSPQQRSLWTLQQTVGGQSFRASGEILITGELDPTLLKQALTQVVENHEILRTTFRRPAGIKTPFQLVSEAPLFSWTEVDLSEDAETEARLSKRPAAEEVSFDFEHGPLFRACLIKLTAARHLLFISVPALCGDALTLMNITKALGSAYSEAKNDADASMQYADFAEWANELLEADDDTASAGKAHWYERRNLRAPAVQHGKQAGQSLGFQPELIHVELDVPISKLEDLARSSQSSVAAVLFACWQALVWRLAGQTESEFALYCVGNGRKFEDLQTALGPYARYLPIDSRCADESFAAQLRRASDALAAADEWQEYYDPSLDAPFADAIAFECAERSQVVDAGAVTLTLIRKQVCHSTFAMKLSCEYSGDALSAELQFNAQAIEREDAKRIAAYFQRLLEGVLQKPDTEPGEIEILSAPERQRLLIDFNQTAVEFADDKCVHQLFEARAAATPDVLAVVSGEQELTYGLLNERANQLAHLLRQRGVETDTCVGLCVERSVEAIVGLLGILKAGGAYVPLNPDHPGERLTTQLTESQATILITKSEALGRSFFFDGETIDLDRDRELLGAEPKTNPTSINTGENLAYVIYTSGSTGIPKGVAVRHRNLANYTQFMLQRLEIDRPLNFAIVSTITADLGNTCIFPALASGGCLHILDYETGLEGARLRDYFARRPIDVLKIVPSHLSALLSSQPEGKILPAKYLILGGEALSWNLVQRIVAVDHTCRIINHYGPTETTIGSLTFNVDEHDAARASATVPIGRPIANTRLYVLDGRLQPVPIGVSGELFIGGAGVTAGYLNQPNETAARFVPDPFSSDAESRLYRTGDLVRYLSDGNVEFLGRVDTQVKVRGYRVELGEIENALSACDGVHQSVVISQRSPVADGHDRLVAYVAASGATPPTADDLRASLKQRLPDYMVPAVFVFLQTLPLTPNGKIDRAALPAADEMQPGSRGDFVAPRTNVERELATIWASLLKVSAVGVHDNFFDLGGHSLLGTQVVSRMRKEFQLEIPLRALFESPTVAQLATQIEAGVQTGTAEELLAELESLTDEEAEELLAREQTRGDAT